MPDATLESHHATTISSGESPHLMLQISKEPSNNLSPRFLETDPLLEVGILDDLVQNRSNLCVQYLKIREILARPSPPL